MTIRATLPLAVARTAKLLSAFITMLIMLHPTKFQQNRAELLTM